MAKVSGPLMSVTATGKFAGSMVFDKRGWVRKHAVPFNPQSTAQHTYRDQLGDIQRELKQLGPTLRATLKTGLGYRWNSLIIQDLVMNQQAKIGDLTTTYNAFGGSDKTAWAGDDIGQGLLLTAGLEMYLVAKSIYDVTLRITGSAAITAPVAANSATIASDLTT